MQDSWCVITTVSRVRWGDGNLDRCAKRAANQGLARAGMSVIAVTLELTYSR